MSLPIISMFLLSLVLPQAAATPTSGAESWVAGRVLDVDSHAPIAGARVTLTLTAFPPGATTPIQAITDADGQFVFQGLLPGRYRVDVQKIGFAPLTDAADARLIDLAAGQSIAGLELALSKGGTITGRILDARGEPLSEMVVSALRQRPGPRGEIIATTAQMSQTNDLGEFRLASLATGEYLLIAVPLPQRPVVTAQSAGGGMVTAPTYYPGTNDRNAALPVIVTGGQTLTDVQFSMVSMPAYEISGVVLDETGAPVSDAMIMVMPQAGARTPATARSDQNGVFHVASIPAGTYRVTVAPLFTGGGVFVGGAFGGGVAIATGSAAVMPPNASAGMPNVIEVTIDAADVGGLRIILPTRR